MNIFLDCGYYAGNALKKWRELGIVNDKWQIHAFEANPNIEAPKWVRREAVWTKKGKVEFWLSNRENACHVDGTSSNARDKTITVPAIDFSKFVASLPEADLVICSMDIEGSEFTILAKMITDGSINRIDVLDIEFHHRMMADYTAEDADILIAEIKKHGVVVNLNVDLR